ncbi:hypothetical protein [Endozoicomonas sp. OPT23]|uniref:hypothetical protein n=1 Tax=Endozoicomonas sp. OPT23 TaxID=2072845 RepID=UPI00129A4044|nr:hypothetical protein [Endozoicomonas sp. OPT23]
MAGNLIVKDRATRERGRLFQCLKNGRVKVLMESGEVREYLARDLVGTLESAQTAVSYNRRATK